MITNTGTTVTTETQKHQKHTTTKSQKVLAHFIIQNPYCSTRSIIHMILWAFVVSAYGASGIGWWKAFGWEDVSGI